ncbi:hypothetical protein KAR91_36955 [Candidatus Pacearchaeota archaeon]|nr:hypothetical protein [Candidatus Pacearchaeota archaeon]
MFQNMVAYGAREKPIDTVSFAMLRESAQKSFVDRILIRIRKDQMKSIWQRTLDAKSKQPGFKVVHDREDDPEFKVTDEIKKRCREMEDFLANPTPTEYIDVYPHGVRVHTGLKDLVSRLIQAELIIDRKVIRRYHRQDGKGYASFHWLPGDTIKNVDESVREWAKKNEPGGTVNRDTMTKMSYESGFDITQSAYVQMVDGMVVEAYTEDEISVHISNPSDELNKWGYGESRLELSLDLTATLLYAWNYNKELFKTNYPESILTVAGDFDKEGLAAFKQQICGETGGPANNWKLPVISTGEGAEATNFKVEAHKIRDTPKDMLFDQLFRFMIMFKCFKYNTVVETLEHGPMWIGKIACQKLPVHLKSFDRETGEVVWKKVTAWQKMRESRWVKINYPGGGKRRTIEVTQDHDLWNGKEMVPAGSLNAGDRLFVKSPTLTYEQEQVVLGSLLGDGTIRKATKKDSYGVPMLTESHSESQRDYMMWKVAAYENLEPKFRSSYTTAVANGTQKYACLTMHTKSHPVLLQYREMCLDPETQIKRVTWDWLSKIDALGLAVWFMDDGAFHKQKQQNRYSSSITLMPGTAFEISLYWRYFAEKWGLHPRISPVKGTKCWRVRFSVDETERLRQILLPYLDIAISLNEISKTRKKWHAPSIPIGEKEGLAPVKIISVENFEIEGGRPCYDVTVEGTHTLFANGLASSNCAAYGAHPTVLNFAADQGTGNHMGTHNPSQEIAESKEHGLKPSLLDFCEWWTQDLIKPRYDDLKLVLTGFEEEDESQVLELRTKRAKNWLSKNECRMEEGLKPKGNLDDPKNPWNFPADAPMSTYLSTMDMLQGGEGGEDEDGGMFDGFDDDGKQVEDTTDPDKAKKQKVVDRKPDVDPDKKKDKVEKVEKSQRDTKFFRVRLED